MEKGYLSIGKMVKLLGVHVNTLRRREKLGKLSCNFRTVGNHRRYDISTVVALFSGKEESRSDTVGYARVSSADQKDLPSNLCDDVISDIGSGMKITIITVFSSKLYGKRSHKNKKVIFRLK